MREQDCQWKWALVRRLYERGCARQDILNLFRFIDWLLALPVELEQTLWHDMQEYEEAGRMTYVTSVERFGIEKGQRLGLIARGREAAQKLSRRTAAARDRRHPGGSGAKRVLRYCDFMLTSDTH